MCRNPEQGILHLFPIIYSFAKHFQATPETALCRESTSSGSSNTDGTLSFNAHSFCCFPSAVSSVAILSNNACMNSKVKNRDRNVNIVSTNSSAANASAIQFSPYFVNCIRSALLLVRSSLLLCLSAASPLAIFHGNNFNNFRNSKWTLMERNNAFMFHVTFSAYWWIKNHESHCCVCISSKHKVEIECTFGIYWRIDFQSSTLSAGCVHTWTKLDYIHWISF